MDNNNVVLVCVFMGHMCVLQPGICYYMKYLHDLESQLRSVVINTENALIHLNQCPTTF